jgi:hypothetical protein
MPCAILVHFCASSLYFAAESPLAYFCELIRNINSVGMAFSRASEMEDILNEHDTGSELSVEVSFTLEDILNERLSHADEDEDDAEGLFEE